MKTKALFLKQFKGYFKGYFLELFCAYIKTNYKTTIIVNNYKRFFIILCKHI